MYSLSLKGAGSGAAVELDGKQIFPIAVRVHAKPSGTTAVIEVPILPGHDAGDSDRAGMETSRRDHVFDVLRRRVPLD